MDHKTAQRASSSLPDARVVRTRAALREALLTLITRKPLDQITVRDIAAEAGTGYATFFRHYASKAALVDELAAEQVGELMQLAAPLLTSGGTRSAALALCHYVDEHRDLWTALLTGGAAGTIREEFSRHSNEIAKTHSRPLTNLPGDLSIVFGVVGSVEVLSWWLEKGRDIPAEQIAEIIERLVIAPVFNPK